MLQRTANRVVLLISLCIIGLTAAMGVGRAAGTRTLGVMIRADDQLVMVDRLGRTIDIPHSADEVLWSPDGTRLTLMVYDRSTEATNLIDLEVHSGAIAELNDRGVLQSPWHSPDGATLGYVNVIEQTITLRDTMTDAVERVQLDTQASMRPHYFRWSPDGAYIATRDRVFQRQLILDAQTGTVAHMIGHPSPLAFSPEGNRAAYIDIQSNQFGDELMATLNIFTLPDGDPESYSTSYQSIGSLVWSPDGTSIAFAAYRLNAAGRPQRDLIVMDTITGFSSPVTDDRALETGIAWTADGGALVFTSAEMRQPPRACRVELTSGVQACPVAWQGAEVITLRPGATLR